MDYSLLWRSQLADACAVNNISLSTGQSDQVVAYLNMLHLWNKKHNLTRVPPEYWVVRHIIDSLSLLPYVRSERFLDVGSGAGFPGVVLAIFSPESEVVLLDALAKRCGFLQQVISDIGLHTVHVHHGDVRKYTPKPVFNRVVARAFSSLGNLCAMTEHLVAPEGYVFAMKAKVSEQELAELCCNFEVIEVKLSGVDEARCLVQFNPHS